jgi:calcium-dependent protein kinase
MPAARSRPSSFYKHGSARKRDTRCQDIVRNLRSVHGSSMQRLHPRLPPLACPLLRFSAHVRCRYTFGRTLGKGQFGTTRLVTEKSSGKVMACKSISKRTLATPDDIADVQREVQIMHHLAGHPHVVQLHGTYEDRQHVHLVMELCEGGELFDRIVARGKYSERDAADAIRTIVQVRHTTPSQRA